LQVFFTPPCSDDDIVNRLDVGIFAIVRVGSDRDR
jgi:hypothetical protein